MHDNAFHKIRIVFVFFTQNVSEQRYGTKTVKEDMNSIVLSLNQKCRDVCKKK